MDAGNLPSDISDKGVGAFLKYISSLRNGVDIDRVLYPKNGDCPCFDGSTLQVHQVSRNGVARFPDLGHHCLVIFLYVRLNSGRL